MMGVLCGTTNQNGLFMQWKLSWAIPAVQYVKYCHFRASLHDLTRIITYLCTGEGALGLLDPSNLSRSGWRTRGCPIGWPFGKPPPALLRSSANPLPAPGRLFWKCPLPMPGPFGKSPPLLRWSFGKPPPLICWRPPICWLPWKPPICCCRLP